MYCSKCGKEINDDATFCPTCGAEFVAETATKVKKHPFLIGCSSFIVGLIILTSFVGIFSDTEMSSIENKVAEDAVEQYNIAKAQGDKMQACVQAGLVSAAYLQAKDSDNYNKWKATEKTDCNKAGIAY
ncbi:MAG: zinc-ribbon domain-containing protein [Candidatus Gastranaerophilales bacterium]|nr:zinc-ribbon domain-containing protein [Candidatus Gastranaerophilales bacterium]